MQATAEPRRFEYDILTGKDVDEMACLLGDVFSRRDPPAVAAGLTPAEFEAFVRLFCDEAASAGLTVVARDAVTGEMAGALLTEDGAATMPEGLDRLSPKFEPIFDILGQLDAEHRAGRAVQPGESLHLFLVGVAQLAFSPHAGEGGRRLPRRGLASRGLEAGRRRAHATARAVVLNMRSYNARMRYLPRELETQVTAAPRGFAAVVLTGPRRAGKTSLLRRLLPAASYHLFEDPDVVERFRSDPRAFLDDVELPAILDEVQNVRSMGGLSCS